MQLALQESASVAAFLLDRYLHGKIDESTGHALRIRIDCKQYLSRHEYERDYEAVLFCASRRGLRVAHQHRSIVMIPMSKSRTNSL